MNIQFLKAQLKSIIYLLDSNLSLAYDEWMRGDIARGAFEYCLSRHGIALELLTMDDCDIDIDRAYLACAPITIDLRSAINDMQDKSKIEGVMEAWLECFRVAGYTEIHPVFNFPIRILRQDLEP